MGTVSPSGQICLWRYQTPLVGRDLAQVNADIIYPGIYQGLVASLGGGAVVNFTPGTCLIQDLTDYGTAAAKAVKISCPAAFSLSCDTAARHRYIVMRYQWLDAVDVFATVLDTDDVKGSDLILCAIEWSGTTITRVDTDSATKGFRDKFDLLIKNLEPVASPTLARTVVINKGRYVYGKSSIYYGGGSHQFPESLQGRYDIIGLTTSGAIIVVTGTEGGDVPAFGAFLPIAAVHIRPGVSCLLQSDVLDVRPFLTFSGVLSADLISIASGSYTFLPKAGYVADVLTWLDGHLGDGITVNAGKLAGHSYSASAFASGNEASIPSAGQVSSKVAEAQTAAQAYADDHKVDKSQADFVALKAFMAYVAQRDIAKVEWFAVAKTEAEGWLRADGSIIDKAAHPKYAALVDKLKVEANGDSAHPYYHADPNKAKLPDIKAYVKEIGTSGQPAGKVLSGDLLRHQHGLTLSMASPDSHTHAMNHAHANSGKSSGGPSDRSLSLSLGPHAHGVHVPSQDIGLDVPTHSHNTDIPKKKANTGIEITCNTPGANYDVHKTISVVAKDASCDSATPAISGYMAIHSHPIPATDTYSGNTGAASPDKHTHVPNMADAGNSDTNEVNRTLLYAYICFQPVGRLPE